MHGVFIGLQKKVPSTSNVDIFFPENHTILLKISFKKEKFEMLSITKAELSLPDAYKRKGVYLLFFKEKYKE